VLFLGGCVSPLFVTQSAEDLRASGEYIIIDDVDVPRVEGLEGCGAQALAAAMALVDPETDADAIAAELPWHDDGANPVDLLLEARRRGFEARIARGTWDQLDAAARSGHAVIVMLDSAPVVKTLTGGIPTPRVMHWSIVSGIATDASAILLGAPRGRHHRVQRDDFETRWAKSDQCTITINAAE
jgi:hypothetical protein